MTKAELKTAWEKVLQSLESKMDKIKIDSYFKPLTPVKLNEKTETLFLLSVGTSSSFFQNMINRNSAVLDEVIKEVFGKSYKIEITEKDIPEEEEQLVLENQLDPKYTFESFVPGNNSRLAYAAAFSVAEGYDKKYNPLFLYGGSGLGKTHLMQAIGQYVLKNKPTKKVLFVSAETFTNDFISSLRLKNQEEFRNKYRNADYLLFDDVQFIAGKTSTEEELFNTFDALYSSGKQIVFTSDRPPKELGEIPERLLTRFSWGLIADIQTPDYETRLAILRNKATLEDVNVNDPDVVEALDTIAFGIQSNIRELESAFTRVLTFSTLTGEKINKEFTKKVLSDVYATSEKTITPEDIKKAVASYYSLNVKDLESKNRSRVIAYPRQIAIYLIKEKTDYSLNQIAKYFGGQDHSTILYSYNKIKDDIKSKVELRTSLNAIEELLN